MDFLQSEQGASTGQGCDGDGHRPYGSRRCLLKGCERWFQAARPQARYCSAECREAALRWRRWRAARRYRASPQGKVCRQAQNRRYRERRRERQQLAAVDAETPREGQRAAGIPENFRICSCARPGCYVEFAIHPRSPQQQFCCFACHQALRRVLQRERRLRERRRQGIEPRRRRPRGPP